MLLSAKLSPSQFSALVVQRELTIAGVDGLLRVYLIDPEELLSLAHSRLTRWFTEDECRRFLHLEACPAAPE